LRSQAKEADERLLIEAAQKDPARFVDLYENNFERVYAFVSRRVHSRADAEDVTAEVFQDALENLQRFEWRGAPFAAWLYRIAANAIADRWQRVSREQGSPLSGDPADPSEAVDVEKSERTARLFNLVEGLPEDQRRVIEMRFAEEKKHPRDRTNAWAHAGCRKAAPVSRHSNSPRPVRKRVRQETESVTWLIKHRANNSTR
jgi:RNA polymerase sigma-70 factor (ECF subfamily)